jgi:tetratricopeptide (TPR) repeat protein
LIEALDYRFQARAKIVLVAQSTGQLQDYVDLHLPVRPDLLLSLVPNPEHQVDAAVTVPGHEGPVVIATQDLQWFSEIGELLTSTSGGTAEGIENVGLGFLQGRAVSWFELGLNLDVIPAIAGDLETRIREDLGSRDTRRISLLHYPGAGGSTLARRMAWQAHHQNPTVYCPGVQDEAGLALRVETLAQKTGLSVLLILEQTTDVIADRLYNRLRSDSVPAVIVVVSRRLYSPKVAGPRSFYLGFPENRSEVNGLRDRYVEYAPHRRSELDAIREGTPNAVPFIFGLTAFQEEFFGLEDYVRHSLAPLSDDERVITMMVALSHRYAGVSVAGDLFAGILAVTPEAAVDLNRLLSDEAKALIVEDGEGFWRTPHWLVSSEILEQLLAPKNDRDSWKLGLSGLALRVIAESLAVFGQEAPEDIEDLLKRLFIIRENRELFGDEKQRAFSDLVEDIPSVDGRLEVLRQLAESFPSEPHFWAHYGRLLSYQAGNTQLAMKAINQAVTLDGNDPVFYHMRGMVLLRQLRNLRQQPAPLGEDEVLRLTEMALADFARASEIDDDSEYPYVATIQVAVEAIEMVARASKSSSLADFLAKPTSGSYRSLLGRAEDALSSIKEIRGADPISSRAEAARVSLSALYDDYSALLQGWRNLLDRPDTLKGPIRKRLVGAYVRRAGDWARLEQADQRKVLELLEENLRDDPTDVASLRDWIRAGRKGVVSLERGAELVSYWAQRSTSREALYYDYVIAVLQVIQGRESNWQEAKRKIDKCRERSMTFGNRKFSYEWLGCGEGLATLIHYSELPSSADLNRPGAAPKNLRRVSARITSINSPQSGTLRLEPSGLDAFFVPARAGALRGRHENARVEATVGFSYDGLRAWSVQLRTSEEPEASAVARSKADQ